MPLVAAVLAWLVEKIGAKSFFVATQFAGSTAFITAHAIALYYMAQFLIFVYNQYNDFMNYIASMQTVSDFTAMAFNFLRAIGFIDAFNNVFALFSPYLNIFFLYVGATFTYKILHALSNEFFKVGVLWQQ